ncbi:methyltransferase [Magnetovirga frankeli]|uniref:class I SAM-dependent methyltransferase n=1 Tax=Magnetovirga frankeli TaxID=947516 RepID=UPI001293D03C|nr:methyltransferase [gamma proteobacterium SS-5]
MNLLPDNLDEDKLQWLEGLRQDLLIETSLRGQPLRFHTTWGLFSPKQIDEGSRLLLDHIEIASDQDSADLGCGYGPLGLTLARLAPQGHHCLLDKDFVAVEYSRKNARLNRLDNVEVLLSNGFDQLDGRRFGRIVSNLPAKTGKEQYYLYFYEALARLEPGGRFYVVTINGLREFIKRSFKEVFGNYSKLKQGRSYTVSLACKD